MQIYLDLLADVLRNGVEKEDRTGTGTYSVFGRQIRHNLQDGFPILTTKRLPWKSIAHELFWMLNGSTNVKDLQKYGVTIWDEWGDESGELGPVYGSQWRNWLDMPSVRGIYLDEDLPFEKINQRWEGVDECYFKWEPIDQISIALAQILANPDSRRIIVSAWNPAQIESMKLPPCHMMFQFYVANGRLSCSMYQRSADIFLGVPFNIASYALLTHLVAYVTNLDVGEIIITFGDLHIYKNHVEQVLEQLKRQPERLPELRINFDRVEHAKLRGLDTKFPGCAMLVNYNPAPKIVAQVAV